MAIEGEGICTKQGNFIDLKSTWMKFHSDYFLSKEIIKQGLAAKKKNDTIKASTKFQSGEQLLEKILNIELPPEEEAFLANKKAMMKKALKCCRDYSFRLDRKQRMSAVKNQTEMIHPAFDFDANVQWQIPGGVQLFVIQNDDKHLPVNEPTSLQVIVAQDENNSNNGHQCFIKVKDWVFTLVPGKSQVTKCLNEMYLFPIPTSSSPPDFKAFGLVISDQLDFLLRDSFEKFLEQNSIFTIVSRLPGDEAEVINLSKTVCFVDDGVCFPPTSKSEIISNKIQQGAQLVSSGLVKGANVASHLIECGSKRFQQAIEPDDEPTRVNEKVGKTLSVVNSVANVGVQASGMLVCGMSKLAGVAAQHLAPHVRTAAIHLTSAVSSKADEKNAEIVDNVINVARTSAAGLTKVWSSFEEASMVVVRAASDATVDTVHHKYGEEAATAVGQATGAIMSLGKVAHNVNRVGMKMLVKGVGKEAGKEFLETYTDERNLVTPKH